MKVAVVSNKVPFLRGGAEELLDELVVQLRRRGHEAEPIQLAFSWRPPQRVIEHMLAARLTRLGDVDRVIALKFPAYYVPHDDKVLWLLHQFRQAYDLWGGPLQDLPDTDEGRVIRSAVIGADNRLLRQVRRIYTNSAVTQERLWRFNGIRSEVLLPPVIDPDSYRVGKRGDYILCAGRVNSAKRQHLVVEAMRHVRSPVRLVIAGAPETEADARRIRKLIAKHRLAHRVETILRWISHEEKVELLAGSLAVAYLPIDEDSYGYVALEAMHVHRAVLSCTDSGGLRSIVRDGVSGHVVEPDPRSIAAAIDALASDRAGTARMGATARELIDSLGLSWDHVVERLTT